jgi:hypothetical protein
MIVNKYVNQNKSSNAKFSCTFHLNSKNELVVSSD